MSEKKKLGAQLKKDLTKKAMKYLSTPEGMQKFQQLLETKKRADRFLGTIYGLAGLPNLADKQQVEWAVERQAKRLRELTSQVDKVESLLGRLETLMNEPPVTVAPAVVETPAATPSPKPIAEKKPAKKSSEKKAPAAKAPVKKTAAPRKPARKAVPAKSATKRPKPLGAVPSKTPLSGSKSLLDLNWKKKK